MNNNTRFKNEYFKEGGSVSLFDSLFEEAPMGYVRWDADLNVLEWNSVAESIFGYTKQEAIETRLVSTLTVLETKNSVADNWNNLKHQKGEGVTLSENLTKTGTRIICEWFSWPVVNAAGDTISMVSLVNDVTYKERASQELEEMSLSLHQEVQIFKSFYEIGSLIQQHVTSIPHLISSSLYAINRIFAERPLLTVTIQYDGEVYPDEKIKGGRDYYRTELTGQGKSYGSIVVTTRERSKESIASLREEQFFRTVAQQLGLAINRICVEEEVVRAKNEAEEATRAKSGFLTTMSHEIRTPMNGIIAILDLLSHTQLTDEQREYLDIVHRSGDNLLTIVNDILDYSKAEAGKMVLEQVSLQLDTCIEDTFRLLGTRAEEKGINLFYIIEKNVPNTICGDPVRLRQILTNIVGNAVKFTDEGQVSVTLSLSDSRKEVVFSVTDSGIGIPESHLPTLFDSFSQAGESITRRFGGSGLGLAITAQLVELVGGEIVVESKEGDGSTFTFTLPFNKETADHNRPFYPEIPKMTGVRVGLCVKDRKLEGYLASLFSQWRMIPVRLKESTVADQIDVLMVDCRKRDTRPDIFGTFTSIPKIAVLPFGKGLADVVCVEPDGLIHTPLIHSDVFSVVFDQIYDPSEKVGRKVSERHLLEKVEYVSSLRVLAADDDLINRRVLKKIFDKIGIPITVVKDGQQALDRIVSDTFDLVLLDMNMPKMDGLTTARTIRELQLGDEMKIVMVTAGAAERSTQASLDVTDDFMLKPVRLADIENLLSKWFPAESSGESPADMFSHIELVNVEIIDGIKELADEQEPDFATELIDVTLANSFLMIKEIDKAYNESNCEVLAHISHRLKGAIVNIGSVRLTEMCRIIEFSALGGELTGIGTTVDGLHDCFDETAKAISELML